MKPLELAQVAAWCGGELRRGRSDRCIHGVSTDTRTIRPGSLFVALKGDKFDGHDFVEEARKAGAIAAVVSRMDAPAEEDSFGWIVVPDTLVALQRLATAYRASLPVKVVGVTGSNGKSSTKEMIHAVLARKFRTAKTVGNLNNHIGVPLTLLGLDEETEWAVVEMGMNHPGEIAVLAEMGRPDAAVVTNVGWAHIEAFADREGIAEEKGALVRALRPGGLAVLNGDDERVSRMAGRCAGRVVTAGFGESCTHRVAGFGTGEASCRFDLILGGNVYPAMLATTARHMASNAALAAALGWELGVPGDEIAEALADVAFPPGRCQIHAWRGGWLVDDTYNANPDSMLAGAEMLAKLPGEGRLVALLGAMGELGRHREELHRLVGRSMAGAGVGLLFALGDDSRWTVEAARAGGMSEAAARWFAGHEELAGAYLESARDGDRILVKGSRSQQMEKVVRHLLERGDA
jgi:UDP-N-acetylmuramoyl-tripeptide--D-alanyl-D-alanine ligase